MHNAAFAALGLRARYQRLPVAPEHLEALVRALPGAGFRGANVTVPHKEAALALADEASPAARAIGAANTLTFAEGRIRADNTDAPGLLAALPGPPAGRRALVLGAGGSARAAVHALLEGGADVHVWNRTPERARGLGVPLGAPEDPDLLVNCTTVGLHDPQEPFKTLPLQADDLGAGTWVVDLVYRDGGTELLRAARARGATVVDGLEILVAQGAASFAQWTGRTAPVHVMREAVGIAHT
jgi:shikimate dehydrogenase